jgi:hypothetical protein
MVKTSANSRCMAAKASKAKRASTPASKAAARACGMRSMTRANQPVAPARVMSSAHTRKAPTPSAMGTPTPAVASKAAPGVDQAVSTGWRYQTLSPRLVRPMPRPRAQIQEAACAGVAPKAAAA